MSRWGCPEKTFEESEIECTVIDVGSRKVGEQRASPGRTTRGLAGLDCGSSDIDSTVIVKGLKTRAGYG